MARNPVISVVMPVYNQEEYISEAIESVIRQTYQDWELIIVNDGSTDNTENIIRDFAQKDHRIRIRTIGHTGVSAARNTGLREAAGEWIAFIDSDDYYRPEALDILLLHSENRDCVIAAYEFVSTHQTPRKILEEKNGSFRDLVAKDFPALYWGGAFHCVYAKLYRKETITGEFVKGLHYAEDLMFNLDNLPDMNRIRVIPDVIYGYRYRQFVSCGQRIDLAQVEIEREILNRWRQLLWPEYLEQLSAVFQYYIRSSKESLDKLNQLTSIPSEVKKRILLQQINSILLDENAYGFPLLPAQYQKIWEGLKRRKAELQAEERGH